MKTMSFNILCYGTGSHVWHDRIPLVVQTIRTWDADTFGVQEAHWEWMQKLCDQFPDYSYVGIGRDDGKKDGEFATVFYKTALYEPIDQGHFWLSETPERAGSLGWDAACIRICSWVRLRDKVSGQEFVHMNTHLDHVGKTAMKKGAQLLCERASAFPAELPVILTGDFNATPESDAIRAITHGGFRDVRDLVPTPDRAPTFHGFDPDASKHVLIDYIFLKGNVTAKTMHVFREPINGAPASDHYAVGAELAWE